MNTSHRLLPSRSTVCRRDSNQPETTASCTKTTPWGPEVTDTLCSIWQQNNNKGVGGNQAYLIKELGHVFVAAENNTKPPQSRIQATAHCSADDRHTGMNHMRDVFQLTHKRLSITATPDKLVGCYAVFAARLPKNLHPHSKSERLLPPNSPTSGEHSIGNKHDFKACYSISTLGVIYGVSISVFLCIF